MQKLILIFIFLLGLIGCVAQDKGKESKANCPEFYQFDTVTRKCFLGAKTPVATLKNATLVEDTPQTVILTYINPQGNPSVSCNVTNNSTWLFTLDPCVCAGGVCEVVVRPVLNQFGDGGFNYTVTDNVGEESVPGVVAVKITPVNDAPTVSNVTRSIVDTNEGYNAVTGTFPNTNTFTFPIGSDVDNLDTTLTYSLVPGQTLRGTLTGCLNGSTQRNCTYVLPESQLNGVNEVISYRAFDGELYSTAGTITLTIPNRSTNDEAPFIVAATKNLTMLEEEEKVFSFSYGTDYIDPEGDLGVDCSIVSATGVRQTKFCSCTLAGVCSVTLRALPGVTTSGSFGYRIITGTPPGLSSTNIGSVNLTMTAVAKAPVAISKNITALESSNAIANQVTMTLDPAVPSSSTTTTTYEAIRIPNASLPAYINEGTLSGCLSGTTITNLNNCVFTPTNGNINDLGGDFATATFMSGATGIHFRSQTKSLAGNDIIIVLQGNIENNGTFAAVDNLPIITVESPNPSTITTAVRIRIRYRPTYTTANQIISAINNHVMAKEIVVASLPIGVSSDVWNADTAASGSNLSGGGNPTSYFTYKARRGTLESPYLATVAFSLTPVNDDPVICAYSKYQGDMALASVMPIAHECGLEGCIRNSSPQVAQIVPTTTGLIFFDQKDGICYKSTGTSSHNDWAVITSGAELIPNVTINEKDRVIISGIKFDEGGGPGHESDQSLTVTNLASSNTTLIPPDNIKFYYKMASATAYDINPIDPLNAFPFGNGLDPAGDFDYRIVITPVGTLTGTSTISFRVTDNGTPARTTNVSFNVTVNPLSAQHKGWKELKAIGAKTDKFGQILGVANTCQHSIARCNNGKDCIGTNRASFVPDANNVIFYEASSNKCYYSNSGNWNEFASVCNVSPSVLEPGCRGASLGESCIGTSAPSFAPFYTESYYLNRSNNRCYRSVGTTDQNDWVEYIAPTEVTLSWEDFYVSGGGSISGYNVYRKVAGQEFNYDIPINKIRIAAGQKSYVDNNVNSRFAPVAGTVYYYEVKPVVGRIGIGGTAPIAYYPTQTNETYKTVRMISPLVNTGFVHRWMANKTMCKQMHKTTDPNKNFRCQYRGPGEVIDSLIGYYDFGKDLIVDRFEVGCNYSNTGCDTVDGSCIGLSDPINPGTVGRVYYSRTSGKCFRDDGTNWVDVNTATALIANRAGNLRSNVSRLPPVTNIRKDRAEIFCQNSTRLASDGIFGLDASYIGTRSLPTRKDQVVYSFWDQTTITSSEINMREGGLSLNAGSKCNTSRASGLENGYSDSDTPDSSSLFSLPGTFSSNIRSVVTGSTETLACTSRFGVQDSIGNVSEWLDETFDCISGGPGAISCEDSSALRTLSLQLPDTGCVIGSCTGTDGFNATGDRYSFNGDIGTCPNDHTGCIEPTDPIDPLVFQDRLYAGHYMFLPVGLPVNLDFYSLYSSSDVISSLIGIGSTGGITNADLHLDSYNLNFHNPQLFSSSNAASMVAGGGYRSGSGAGTYNFELVPAATESSEIGFRCKIDIEKASYLFDKDFTYDDL